MKSIRDVDVAGKRVLLRCDFNCPINENGDIQDDFRIKRAMSTIEYLFKKNAKIILMSHLDDPQGKIVEKLRLTKVQNKLFEYLDLPIVKASDCVGEDVKKMVEKMREWEILLLENLRFHEKEETNDDVFAKNLASLGDIFVNDAFGASHRNHTSIVGIPKYLPAFAGFLLEEEFRILTEILENPKRPLLGIFGGVKVETKLPTIKKFLEIADYILVGGKIAKEIKFSNPKLSLGQFTKDGFDINEETIKRFEEIIKKAKTIVWNGPLGFFEKAEYEKGTKEISLSIANSGAFKIAGGGETLFAVSKYNIESKINFLSTGGGAMLKFLAGEKLPGIEVLNN